jgi:integrase
LTVAQVALYGDPKVTPIESASSFKFTIKRLDGLPASSKGRVAYYDTQQLGLQLRVTATGTKSFSVRKKIDGKTIRATLGKYPFMTIDQARNEAAKAIASLVVGDNPNEIKRTNRLRGVTLSECRDDYWKARPRAANTIKAYNQSVDVYLKDWRNSPLNEITRNMVSARHRKIAKTQPVAANNVMRHLRAFINFAIGEYEVKDGSPIILDNPVRRISHNRAWSVEHRKTTVVENRDLPAFFSGTQALRESAGDDINASAYVVADYLELILLNGLRRDDALCLEWNQIELDAAIYHPVIHKKKKEVVSLPIPDYILAMLKRRSECRVSEFVFPGRHGRGRYDDPRTMINRVRDCAGIKFTSHDLRRTFLTIASNLDVSVYVIKRLATHSINADVTGGYIVLSAERMREPAQKVENLILKAAGKMASADVLSLPNVDRMKVK